MAVSSMRKGMVIKLLNNYIGVSGGYLGDFTKRSHREFYAEYCDLDIDIGNSEGTTRDHFAKILSEAESGIQAKILQGILKKYPIGGELAPPTRTPELALEFRSEIRRLEGLSLFETTGLTYTVEIVERALKEAKILIQQADATSAVDRIHTALHGYMKCKCVESGIPIREDARLTLSFSTLKDNHPALQLIGPHSEEMRNILKGMGTMLEAFNSIRNNGSMAHPNSSLLPAKEAMLMVSLTYSILHYLDSKLSS